MHGSFGGTARNKPRINLGGTRRELTKEELLKKATADRKQREDYRRRDAAAIRIQRQWEIKKARIEALDVLRGRFDELWSRLDNGTTSEESCDDALMVTPAVFRLYKYFFHAKRDKRRTVKVLRFLLQYTLTQEDQVRAHEQNWAILIAPCFARTHADLLLQQRRRSLSLNEEDSQLASSLIEGIRKAMFWSSSRYALFRSPSYCALHYGVMARELERQAIPSGLSEMHEPSFNALYDCVCLPLHASDTTAHQAFCAIILSSSALPDHTDLLLRCQHLEFSSLVHAFNASSVLEELDGPVHASIVSRSEHRLWSFVSITYERLAQNLELRDVWIDSICAALRHFCLAFTYQSQSPDERAYSRFNVDLGQDPIKAYSFTSEHNSMTLDTLGKLTRGSTITSLLSPFPAKKGPEFFGFLFAFSPDHKEPLLLTISMIATGLNRPNTLLRHSYLQFVDDAKSMLMPTIGHPIFSPVLAFYLELLSRILLTMVDDEFFDPHGRSFDIDMIVDTAMWLKQFAYPLMLQNSYRIIQEIPFKMTAAYCQDLVARVLQQIQTRDVRRPFLSGDFWLNTKQIPALKPSLALDAFREDDLIDEYDPLRKWKDIAMVKMLNNFPYMFPFHARIQSLQNLVQADFESNGYDDYWHPSSRHHVTCRREHEFIDGLDNLWSIGGSIKGPLSVDYRDVYGLQEAGIDGGGLTKEFLTAACKQAFSPEFGLFVETPEHLLYPNPSQEAKTPDRLKQYQFLGRIIARCIYSSILVDVAFAPFFLLRWVGKLAYIDDLQGLDQDLYNGLIKLKKYTGDVENDFSLDFTVDEDEGDMKRSINLLPNGTDIAVTRQNRLRYIHLVCHYKLNARIDRQAQAFVRGMSEVLDLRWLGMFNQSEVQALIGGAPVPIDLDDLQANTVYGGFGEEDVTVKIFWDVVRSFTNEEMRKLVKFVTSTPRPPLLGFKELNPKFSLRWGGADTARLPTASTCVNLLKLPAYSNHAQMREKLRLSINAEAGFDLS